jgi:hypothetical protein
MPRHSFVTRLDWFLLLWPPLWALILVAWGIWWELRNLVEAVKK